MNIAILTHNLQSYSLRKMVEMGKELGHSLQLILISYCYMNVSAVDPTVYYRDDKRFDDLDAIVPHITAAHSFYGTAVLRQFEMMGVYALNNSISITWSRDKLRTLQILARKKFPLPITGFADTPEESEKLIDVVGGAPLIVRLLEGTQGKGTVFAGTNQAALSVINAFKQLKTNILVQEYVKEANGADIRCFVLGNRVLASIQRSPTESPFQVKRRKTHEIIPIEITPNETKLAIEAAEAMKLNFASVDLIRSHRGPLIYDIDSSPRLDFLDKETNDYVIQNVLQFILENAKKTD